MQLATRATHTKRVVRHPPPPWVCVPTTRLEEKLGKVGGESGDGKDGEGKDGAENEFVRASKEKFSGAQKALDENSMFSKLRCDSNRF